MKNNGKTCFAFRSVKTLPQLYKRLHKHLKNVNLKKKKKKKEDLFKKHFLFPYD